MGLQFTPAAERALLAASAWISPDDGGWLEPPELLLGLLAEGECRAAVMLAGAGIDRSAVEARWTELRHAGEAPARARNFSPALSAALAAAQDRLVDYPRPLVLATEHLLLGLAASGDEVSTWLNSRGVAADQLETEIHRLYGQVPGPVAVVEWDGGKAEGEREKAEGGKRKAEHGDVAVLGNEPRVARSAAPESGAGQRTIVLRILDASANRAREGLRVVEDFLRFGLDDRHLTETIKRLRHELADVLQPFYAAGLVASRDTLGDVGTSITTTAEQSRLGVADVVAANFKRIEEAFRSLEEYGKIIDPSAAARLEQLRYRVYTLERAVETGHHSRERLAAARLYVLVDGRESRAAFSDLVRTLVATGVHVLQMRDKQLADRQLVERARILCELTQGTSTLAIINDRADIASLVRADGVHVGQDELSVKEARSIVGTTALIGVSTHSLAQARQAVLDGASYIGVGPTFPSTTKSFAEFPGLELIRAVSAEITLPSFAIGGITLENLSEVLAAGATRVAVSSAVGAAADPAMAIQNFVRRLN
jgi:thiamine-phosphate pyrophosphorylase